VSAAILAGGQATRFSGRDKSALVVDGRTILDRQLSELSSLTGDVMIVGASPDEGARAFLQEGARAFPDEGARTFLNEGARAFLNEGARASLNEGARAFQASGTRRIADIVPGCGPLGGLHAALTHAHEDHVFVVACDMPYVTAAFGEYLLSLAGAVDVVVPRTERGYHPLCAVYARACLEPIAARLAERRLALHELLTAVPARVVTEEEMSRFGTPSRLLANVNTPAEYASLEALQGHKL
jgi:molybdopterin-guanine dinucleotide biosynthesis protein A